MSMIRAIYCIRPDERGYDTRKVEKFAPFRSGFERKRQDALAFFAGKGLAQYLLHEKAHAFPRWTGVRKQEKEKRKWRLITASIADSILRR